MSMIRRHAAPFLKREVERPSTQWSVTRKISRELGTNWKQQRDSDIYANRAIKEGMRSRAAYKLEEINNRFGKFLRRGKCVVDLGAAPGGFSLIAAKNINVDYVVDRWHRVQDVTICDVPRELKKSLGGRAVRRRHGTLICVDMQDMEPIDGAIFIKGDLSSAQVENKILYALSGREADVVLSDMAPATTGERDTDHFRSMELADEALSVANKVLRNGGTFCCKVFTGKDEREFREDLRSCFRKVRAIKPEASRKVSRELYYVAEGFVPKHMQCAEGSTLLEDEYYTLYEGTMVTPVGTPADIAFGGAVVALGAMALLLMRKGYDTDGRGRQGMGLPGAPSARRARDGKKKDKDNKNNN